MKFLKEKIKTILCLNKGWDEEVYCVMYFSGMFTLTLFMILKYIRM